MKRRWLAGLLALVMCAVLLPGAALAEEQGNQVDWDAAIELTDETEIVSSGNYILKNNVERNSSLVIQEGIQVNLNLNGYTLSNNTQGFVINVTTGATLNIYDTSEDKTGTITGSFTGIFASGATLNLYGGTITGCDGGSNYGGGINITSNNRTGAATVNMYEGVLIEKNRGIGGGIQINGGSRFTMYGGEIVGNQSSGSIGGGIYIEGNTSVFTMNGGTIHKNQAVYGAGIYVFSDCTLNLSGGRITANVTNSGSVECGSGIYVGDLYAESAILNFSDDIYIYDNFDAYGRQANLTSKHENMIFHIIAPLTDGARIGLAFDRSGETIVTGWNQYMGSQTILDYFTADCEDVVLGLDSDGEIMMFTYRDVTGLILNPNELSITIGDAITLVATVEPEDATDKTVTWSTSDPSVVTVDQNGNVTAVGAGTAVITATAGGVSAECAVTVSTPYIPPADPSYIITVDPSDNGVITVSPTVAREGQTVAITVTPETGYELEDITVTDRNGERVTVISSTGGTYLFTMPNGQVTVSATFTETVLPFSDVDSSDWFYDAVKYVYDNGLMNGVDGGIFDPHGATTRGQIVTILWRLEGSPVVNYAMDYDDVADSDWYAEAIRWASSTGIVGGYDDGSFGPKDAITREQMAAMLYRYAQYKGYDVSGTADLNELPDGEDTSVWATDSMSWAVAERIITGGDGNLLQPQGNAIRAQAATILMRFCMNIVQ